MIEVSYNFQRAGYATPGGVVIPMPETSKVYSETSKVSEDSIIEITDKYGRLLRNSDKKIPFSKFLLTQLNKDNFFKTYPRGLYIEDKELVKKLVRENIPGDVADEYWEINRKQGVSYVPINEFQIGDADRIEREWSRVKSLEETLDEINNESGLLLPRVPEDIRRRYESEYGDEADVMLNRDFCTIFRIFD